MAKANGVTTTKSSSKSSTTSSTTGIGSPTFRTSNLKILTLSWNMGNARADEFGRVIPIGGGDYDIIVLGLQEATWTIKKEPRKSMDPNMVSLSEDEPSKKTDPDCVRQLLNDLNEVLTPNFPLVVRIRRVQMQLLVFAKQSVRDRITNIEKIAENTGFFHVFPNKGGLRISFTIDQTSIAFLSCHLTAHEGVQNCMLRNESVQEILDGVLSNQLFHHVFFMGDMNYRITFDPTTPADVVHSNANTRTESKVSPPVVPQKKLSTSTTTDAIEDFDNVNDDDEDDTDDIDPNDLNRERDVAFVYEQIADENWSALLLRDELNREILAGRVLKGYQPLEPSFPPTFKRVRGRTIATVFETRPGEQKADSGESKKYNLNVSDENSDTYARYYYDKKRMPSYTDRILTHSLPAFQKNLSVISFNSCEEVSSSDHKPVVASFNLQTTGGLKDIMSYSPLFVTDSLPRYTTTTSYLLKEMKGFDLAEMDSQLFGGGSDPYLVVSADPNEILRGDKLRTRVISHNLNPVWSDSIEFKVASNDLDGLSRNAHLFLTVWDYDVTNDDDLIGTATIPFSTIFQHFHRTKGAGDMPINLELMRSGLVQGRIEAKLELLHYDENKPVSVKKPHRSLYDSLAARQTDLDSGGGHKLHSGEAGCGCVIS